MNKLLALATAILLLTACTAKPVTGDKVENLDTSVKQETTVEVEKKEVVVPQDEDLKDVVDGLDKELENVEVDTTYEDVSTEDLGY